MTESFGKAQRILDDLAERGRKDIEHFLRKASEVDVAARAKDVRVELEKRGTEVVRQLGRFQETAREALGVAGRAQVRELGDEVQRLAKKIEHLARSARKGSPGSRTREG